MAGFQSWGNNETAFHFMTLQGATLPTPEQHKLQDMGKGRVQPYFTNDYYVNAGLQLGITAQQAKMASDKGGSTGSGKARDSAVRSFQDMNDGGDRGEQYIIHRELAAKVTATNRFKEALKSEKAVELLKEGYIVPQIPNNVVTELQHNAALKLQAQTKIDNAAQKAAFWALRNGGKIEATAQMANPISTQTYNIKGEKIVVLGKGIKSQARIQMEKETARIQAEKQKQQEKTSQRQSVADNSKNLPNFDAQSQKYNQNNNVNPSSLYTNQPLIVTGQSQNSSVDVGINSNANYNYATQFNDYQTANPAQSVNLGQQVNPPYFTAGLSSIPDNNEVQTSDLGGDIQHQETDVNTNLEYELPLAQQSTKNVNWDFAQSITAGSSLIPLAGIGLLAYFMGKRK